jgi:AcrR family transcriptional regulator
MPAHVPTQARSEDTRARILQAAEEAFCAAGYDATGVAEICARAGVSKGAFYHHFATKHDAFMALLARWLGGIDTQFAAARQQEATVPEASVADQAVEPSAALMPYAPPSWVPTNRRLFLSTGWTHSAIVKLTDAGMIRGVARGKLVELAVWASFSVSLIAAVYVRPLVTGEMIPWYYGAYAVVLAYARNVRCFGRPDEGIAFQIGTFALAERGRLGWAAVAAGLAALTRAQGLALLPALALFAWRAERRARALATLVVPVALFLVYPVVLEAWIGHGLAFLDTREFHDIAELAQRFLDALVAVAVRHFHAARIGGDGDVVGNEDEERVGIGIVEVVLDGVEFFVVRAASVEFLHATHEEDLERRHE